MTDVCDGWGITPQAVLRTTDGSATWTDVTPPLGIVVGSFVSRGSVFLDAQHAWLPVMSVASREPGTFVYHTSDGGRSWQVEGFPTESAPGDLLLAFADAEHGWAALVSGTPSQPETETFASADGGRRWTGYVQWPAGVAGITWTGPTDGWAVGTYLDALEPARLRVPGSAARPSAPALYRTADDGATWTKANVTLDRSMQPSGGAETLSLLPPVFTQYTAVFPACLNGASSSRVQFFVSNDGGHTWSGTVPLSLGIGGACRNWGFIAPNHLWVAGAHTLHVSLDGGQTWSSVATGLTLTTADEVDFVSPTAGWVVTPNRILRTTDGGAHWTPLGS